VTIVVVFSFLEYFSRAIVWLSHGLI